MSHSALLLPDLHSILIVGGLKTQTSLKIQNPVLVLNVTEKVVKTVDGPSIDRLMPVVHLER